VGARDLRDARRFEATFEATMTRTVFRIGAPGARFIAAGVVLTLAAAGFALSFAQDGKDGANRADAAKKSGARPALTVTASTPQSADWPRTLPANGNIVAWQEAVIGAEISNYRLTDVLVNVGDVVKKGQLLARVSSDTVAAELAQSKAALVEAEASSGEARANADRARSLRDTGALSGQQINQYLTAEQTALARVNAARAKVQADELRLSQTRILAPDNGVISARTATVGSLAQPGQDLFRLIRGGRLEWRAEVTAAELDRIKPGAAAHLVTASGGKVQGKVRVVAPTVDPQTRNALVYVDLPASAPAAGARAGTFARGEFELGRAPALTLPVGAVLLRDGFSYVFELGTDGRVAQKKVTVGRRNGERVEITQGIDAKSRFVDSGAGFLADGDLVRVVDAAAPANTQAKR
jgi:RND family efflux transporter MFP subunit